MNNILSVTRFIICLALGCLAAFYIEGRWGAVIGYVIVAMAFKFVPQPRERQQSGIPASQKLMRTLATASEELKNQIIIHMVITIALSFIIAIAIGGISLAGAAVIGTLVASFASLFGMRMMIERYL